MTRSLKYRRRREGKTNYHKRLKLLQSGKPRMVIRRSNTGMVCQFVRYEAAGDKVVAQATAADVRKAGLAAVSGKSVPAAYLIGYAAASRAKKAGVTEAIVDIGLHTASKGNRLFAAVKGAIDAGVEIPVNEDVLPPQDRLEGKHIQEHRNVTFDINAVKAKLR
jgi:large subunit ribosomal protein L18